jgi:hypothetical protein
MYHDKRNGQVSLMYEGKLHFIPNTKTFNNMFTSAAWKKIVKGVNTDRLDHFEGEPIKNGAFLGKGSGPAVFMVSNEAHHIGNPATFNKCRFDWKKIKKVADAKVTGWTRGYQIKL